MQHKIRVKNYRQDYFKAYGITWPGGEKEYRIKKNVVDWRQGQGIIPKDLITDKKYT